MESQTGPLITVWWHHVTEFLFVNMFFWFPPQQINPMLRSQLLSLDMEERPWEDTQLRKSWSSKKFSPTLGMPTVPLLVRCRSEIIQWQNYMSVLLLRKFLVVRVGLSTHASQLPEHLTFLLDFQYKHQGRLKKKSNQFITFKHMHLPLNQKKYFLSKIKLGKILEKV